jgi:hypothetical protein
MPDAWGFPELSASTLAFIRSAYGVLMIATLLQALPNARRFFLSERWGGYGQRGTSADWVQNPVMLPVVLTVWFASVLALAVGWAVVPSAVVNALLCRYFFIHMRWRGVLRGMGAPGFMSQWLAVAVAVLEWSRRYAPDAQGLALLVIQVDFAFIMLSAGVYKFVAGYRTGNGMELGMVNPEWGYWWQFWGRQRPDAVWFRLFNQLAWSTEVVAALLMVIPQTRLLGGLLIFLSFVFIASQIRLGFLCEMVMVSCLFFVPAGSLVDAWVRAVTAPAPTPVMPVPAVVVTVLMTGLWCYLAALPLAHAGMSFNLYLKRRLPGSLQRLLDRYTNTFGLIVWRVFSADHTNFFVDIEERRADGTRRLVSAWGHGLRFGHVAEAITVTTLFTTLKYYPSQRELFVDRLLRYARTVPRARDSQLAFRYVGIVKRGGRFEHVPAAEYLVDVERGSVDERVLDDSVSVRGLVAESPVHQAVRPGSYAPASS